MLRLHSRKKDELRKIKFSRYYTKYAEGSVLVEYGDTKVLCNVTVIPGVPRFMKGHGMGWLTAEYCMLPRSTTERVKRESMRNGQSGRTQEIQRLIGRSLRAALDLRAIGEYTIMLDCDVIQADGGTRTASITGGCVALVDAIKVMQHRGLLQENPLKFMVASVSVGIYKEQLILDLDYKEDSNADTDMNIVMTECGDFIELQGTAEGRPFKSSELVHMLSLSKEGIKQIITKQKEILMLQ